MSAEHVVGLVGIVLVIAAAVAFVVILRSGSILTPVVLYPLCATCGHAQPEHSRGRTTQCRHHYGHHSWNNDSYGNSQRKFGEVCDCPEFRHKDRAV